MARSDYLRRKRLARIAKAKAEAEAYAEKLERESAERNRRLRDELDKIEKNPRQGRFQLSRIIKEYLKLVQADRPSEPTPDDFSPAMLT